ncbi:MAG: ATP-binding protein, partial [Candidatus Aureabacteria bacterium]|nr:ATP-binding protein [Candidatus Auribacterota bacterium]
MNINSIIMKVLEKNGEVRASDVVKKTGFSRAYVNRFFQELRDEGKIILIGKANRARYVLATGKSVEAARKKIKKLHLILNNKGLAEDKVLDDIKKRTGIFFELSSTVSNIVDYAFTEILNNAIEHSLSEKIDIMMEKDDTHIRFRVDDQGIGIFNNIIEKRGLSNAIEAIQDLLKGKQTTAPDEHSGEGIFFTSKCADTLVIKSSEKKLVFNNLINDIFVSDIRFV